MWSIIAQRGLGFLNKRAAAKTQRSWDRYNNAMAGIQAGQALNAVAVNTAAIRSEDAIKRVGIARSRLMAAARVKAGAAAAGVAGGAVDTTLFDIGRNAGSALHTEQTRFKATLLATDQQRRGIAMQRQLSQKPLTENPSILGAITNTGLEILEERAALPSSVGTQLGGATQVEQPQPLEQLRNMLSI